MKKSMSQNGLILAAFAVITTGLIALTYSGTEEAIKQQQQQQLLSTLNAVIAPGTYNNDIQHDCTIVTDTQLLGSAEPKRIYRATLDGDIVAVAIESTAPDGYSGKIQLVVGINKDAQLTAVRVLEHKETPGLGDKIDLRISDWILGFNGKKLTDSNASLWAVKKDGGQFDQFTGATITPRAVVNAVKRTINYYKLHQNDIASASNQCALATDTTSGETK